MNPVEEEVVGEGQEPVGKEAEEGVELAQRRRKENANNQIIFPMFIFVHVYFKITSHYM